MDNLIHCASERLLEDPVKDRGTKVKSTQDQLGMHGPMRELVWQCFLSGS